MQCRDRGVSVIDEPEQTFAALHAPVAGFTWEVQADLLGSQNETGRIPIHFRQPVEIVGFYASVILLGNAPTGDVNTNAIPRRPTTRDVMALIDINQEDRITNRLESTSVAGPGQSYVTLESLSVQLPREQWIKVLNAAPDFGVQFRWANLNPRDVDGDDEWWHDARVKLAFFCKYLGAPGPLR